MFIREDEEVQGMLSWKNNLSLPVLLVKLLIFVTILQNKWCCMKFDLPMSTLLNNRLHIKLYLGHLNSIRARLQSILLQSLFKLYSLRSTINHINGKKVVC